MTESLVRTDSADIEMKGVPWLGGSSVVEFFFFLRRAMSVSPISLVSPIKL